MNSDFNDVTVPQQMMHNLVNSNGQLIYDQHQYINMVSPFNQPEISSTLYRSGVDKLVPNGADAERIFTLNRAHDKIEDFALHQKWPRVEVSDNEPDVEVAWCHNRGLAIYTEIKLYADTAANDPIVKLDIPDTAAGRTAYLMKNVELEEELVGNNQWEEDWARILPASETYPTVPFSFSHDLVSQYLPLFRFNKGSKLYLQLNTQRELTSLLRMRKARRNAQNDIIGYDYIAPPDLSKLKSVKAEGIIDHCTVNVHYINMLQNERDHVISCSPKTTLWTYQDYVDISAPNFETTYGKSFIARVNIRNIVKCVFIMVQSESATKLNQPYNFTSNASDPYRGWDVVKDVTILGVTIPLIEIKNRMSKRFRCVKSMPKGVLAIPLGLDPAMVEDTVGRTFPPNSAIVVNLTDCSPHRNQPTEIFKVHVKLEVIRQVAFKDANNLDVTTHEIN